MSPKPRKPGWSPVTLTISDEVAQALRLLGVYSGREMGVLADNAIRQGKLFADLAYAQGKDVPASSMSAPAAAPKPAREPGAPRTGTGSTDLFQQLEALMESKQIKQADVAQAVGISSALYRSGWRSAGWVPSKYVPAVLAFLRERGIEPAAKK